VLVVAYRKATISLADEVVFLADGRIVDQGTHAELLARNAAYADLVNAYEQEPDARAAGGEGEEVTVS
jgi:ABC-type transport system involved in Fe-S cluster assembly fused permease/ATPase subunit